VSSATSPALAWIAVVEEGGPLCPQLASQQGQAAGEIGLRTHGKAGENAFHHLEAGVADLLGRHRGGLVRGQAVCRRGRGRRKDDGESLVPSLHRLHPEEDGADPHLVAGLESGALDAHSVGQGAVLAAQVLEDQAVRAQGQQGMAA